MQIASVVSLYLKSGRAAISALHCRIPTPPIRFRIRVTVRVGLELSNVIVPSIAVSQLRYLSQVLRGCNVTLRYLGQVLKGCNVTLGYLGRVLRGCNVTLGYLGQVLRGCNVTQGGPESVAVCARPRLAARSTYSVMPPVSMLCYAFCLWTEASVWKVNYRQPADYDSHELNSSKFALVSEGIRDKRLRDLFGAERENISHSIWPKASESPQR